MAFSNYITFGCEAAIHFFDMKYAWMFLVDMSKNKSNSLQKSLRQIQINTNTMYLCVFVCVFVYDMVARDNWIFKNCVHCTRAMCKHSVNKLIFNQTALPFDLMWFD